MLMYKYTYMTYNETGKFMGKLYFIHKHVDMPICAIKLTYKIE